LKVSGMHSPVVPLQRARKRDVPRAGGADQEQGKDEQGNGPRGRTVRPVMHYDGCVHVIAFLLTRLPSPLLLSARLLAPLLSLLRVLVPLPARPLVVSGLLPTASLPGADWSSSVQ
jgi:hypothetical protein